MEDDKAVLPSQRPAVTPSSASATDLDKASAIGNQTDIDAESSDPIDISLQNEKQDEKQGEKVSSLARQPTATSNSGKRIDRVKTREDGAEYPGGMTLVLIVLALCLSVFTMALGKAHRQWSSSAIADGVRRQFHHRNRHPEDHRRVPESARCWLVRQL